MKYFLDTEFHEYKKKPLFSKAIDTIELISIGIVSEDNRTYYAVSKDFDIKAAWKNEWLRNNVLKPIWEEFYLKAFPNTAVGDKLGQFINNDLFVYDAVQHIVKTYGKSNSEIAQDIKEFVNPHEDYSIMSSKPEFYGYYSDYDWVVFCWLFGRMIDLPKGFPMYCVDLKQTLDQKIQQKVNNLGLKNEYGYSLIEGNNFSEKCKSFLEELKLRRDDYPKQTNEHNALADAMWNKQFYNFLLTL